MAALGLGDVKMFRYPSWAVAE